MLLNLAGNLMGSHYTQAAEAIYRYVSQGGSGGFPNLLGSVRAHITASKPSPSVSICSLASSIIFTSPEGASQDSCHPLFRAP